MVLPMLLLDLPDPEGRETPCRTRLMDQFVHGDVRDQRPFCSGAVKLPSGSQTISNVAGKLPNTPADMEREKHRTSWI